MHTHTCSCLQSHMLPGAPVWSRTRSPLQGLGVAQAVVGKPQASGPRIGVLPSLWTVSPRTPHCDRDKSPSSSGCHRTCGVAALIQCRPGNHQLLAGLRRGRVKSASLRRALSQGHSLEEGRGTRDSEPAFQGKKASGDPSHGRPGAHRRALQLLGHVGHVATFGGAVVRIVLGPGGQGSECCVGSALPTDGGSSAGYLAVRRAGADSLPVLQTGTRRFTPWSQTRGRGWTVQLQDQTLNYLTASHALEHAGF